MNENKENVTERIYSEGKRKSFKVKVKKKKIKEKKSKHKIDLDTPKGVKNPGKIITFLMKLSDKISKGFQNGFFGRFFASAYNGENEALKNGAVCKGLKSVGIKKEGKLKIRNKISSFYENSFFGRVLSTVAQWFKNSYLRLWGVFLITLGIMSEAVYALKFFTAQRGLSYEGFLTGVGIIIISLPLLFSSRRMGEALLFGKITRSVFVKFVGFEEEKLEHDDQSFGGYYSVAFLCGALLGILTYFANTLYYLIAILILVAFVIIMAIPELGLLLTIAFIPFAGLFHNPSIALMVTVAVDLIAFFFKWIRGKRVVKFELLDIFVLILMFLMLFGGIVSVGGRESLNSAYMYVGFMLMYFLIANLFRKYSLVDKAIKLIVFSASIVAIIGIFERGMGAVNVSWVDTAVFAEIGTRVTSLFNNPNMLSIYFVLAFPFLLHRLVSSKTGRERLLYLLCALSLVLCTVFTWSRGAWLGLIVGACLFFICYNIKTIWVLLMGIITAPLWSMLLPGAVIERALSIASLSDSSVLYRIYTWRGVGRMLSDFLFSGIGTGESAFTEVFPMYAYSGTESVMHSHNLYLEIMVQLGIAGLLVFAAVMFFYMQKCFAHIKITSNENSSRITVIAGFSSIAGACVMGLTDHIWYNYRVFLFFWVIIGITCASVRINSAQTEKKNIIVVENDKIASVDIE